MEYTEDRLTPLDYALQNGHEEVAQYLMETGKCDVIISSI